MKETKPDKYKRKKNDDEEVLMTDGTQKAANREKFKRRPNFEEEYLDESLEEAQYKEQTKNKKKFEEGEMGD